MKALILILVITGFTVGCREKQRPPSPLADVLREKSTNFVSAMERISKNPLLVQQYHQFVNEHPGHLAYIRNSWTNKIKSVHWIVPRDLLIAAPSLVEDSPLRCFNFTFQSPWGTPVTERMKPEVIRWEFTNGMHIAFCNPYEDDAIDKVLKAEPASMLLRIALPKYIRNHGYEFFRQIWYTTPADLDAANTSEKLYAVIALLIFKAMDWPLNTDAVFKFTSPNLRGFQFGDPIKTNRCLLEVFMQTDDRRTVIIVWTDAASPSITQDNLCTILMSLKKTDEGLNHISNGIPS